MSKTTYRATRSFYGDLGNFRRNQIVELDPSDKTVKELITKELLSTDLGDKRVGDAAPSLDKMTVDQLKAHAFSNNIDLGSATKKDEILAVIQSASKTG
jgi:hypothetical protein